MSTLLNKSYLVKVSTKGGGGVKNAPNSVYVVCTQPQTEVKKWFFNGTLVFTSQNFLKHSQKGPQDLL